MGTGPIPASKKGLLKKPGGRLRISILSNPTKRFAAQACSVMKELGLDANKVNVNGGAIALGSPDRRVPGARIMTTLLHEMARRGAKKGLATLCIGGGMGIAMCVERDDSAEWKQVA
jgi:acetyl-CoA C-acetyltransferase